jgi:hypothetical protein
VVALLCCGVTAKEGNMARPAKNRTGKRYGRWTVLYRSRRPRKDRHAYWICRCRCGMVKAVSGGNLESGESLSCGCLVTDAVTESNATRYRLRGFGIWARAKQS